jgi:predicted short-subunit dehydrogenase-like oxidoreductase (DUF2520 family)
MTTELPACAVVGRGRLGSALAAALRAAGVPVDGPLGRGATGAGAAVVLLCVPDAEIAAAAACLRGGPDGLLVGHCSGATTLAPLHPHEAFSLHPLMTVPAAGADFAGVPAAIAGDTGRARDVARRLASALGMTPFTVADADRRVGGIDRELLAPIVRATVENWVAYGPQAALTGPIARGDEATVDRQRAAVAERAPDLAPLFDALAGATRRLAQEPVAA